ncbi:creatininase family protein [Lacrimispora sp.]|uniref:creatininase family protein n=1 Tax=Lacrimispora sp. TaxID=2719234 RepID=UPI0026BA8883|nr:creatininase family protein [Lacrimispora sp.]
MSNKMNELDGISIRDLIPTHDIALLPLGAVEVHGPHLPIGTDSFLAEKLCEKLSERVPSLILPVIHYTQVWSLGEMKGSVSISNELLTQLLCEILLETERNGFRMAVMINTHLGNNGAIKEAARKVLKERPDFKILYFTYPGAGEILGEVMGGSNFHGGFFHADEIETSYMLYLCKEHVDMSKAVNEAPPVPELIDVTPIRWSEFTETAVMGNAKDATEEKGRKVIEYVLDRMVSLIEKAKER